MKMNPNFIIERCEKNKVFLSNRKSCKGYYIHLNNERVENLTEYRIESLIPIGFYDEDSYKKPHLINKFISFQRPMEEKKLFSISIWIMIVGIIGAIISVWYAWPVMKDMSNLRMVRSEFLQSIAIFLIGIIVIHEMFHVISARLQQIEVFSIWFKLKFYFIPIFYVKIIPTGNDLKRANIAFAGNIADVLLIMLYSGVVILTEDPMWSIVLSFQLIMSVFNYNILFPTDFYIGLFSFIKKPNFRVESVNFTKQFFRKPTTIKEKGHLLQLIYGILFYGMLTLFIFVTGWNIMSWIMRGVIE
ncbi:hypothetical protein ACQKM9_01630 [Viridibacillus sp. NPDC093762]|uniref:hypothetical protein n=1 Tax=Viridibacillus sp. NPDC093762 TaxID=3390720 RepID=UPI003D076FF3